MTGLWVALSSIKTAVEICKALEKWFPELLLTDWDLSSMEPSGDLTRDPIIQRADILFQVDYNNSEFPTAIYFDRFPGPQDETVIQPVMIELARLFAVTFDCRAICDGSGYGDDEAPFWDIIWDEGKSYLADDCDTQFGDQAGGEVKIIREISLPSFRIDRSGQLTRLV